MPEDTETTSTTTTDDAGSGAGTGAEDVTGLKSALKQERDARKTAEKTLTALQSRIDALEAKDKTDVERLTDERDKLKTDLDAREARLREMAVTTALTNAATKAGARYPELVIERMRGAADLDDDLNVKNADKLVTEAKKSYPDLFRVVEGRADAGEGRNDSAQRVGDMNRLIRQKAGYAP